MRRGKPPSWEDSKSPWKWPSSTVSDLHQLSMTLIHSQCIIDAVDSQGKQKFLFRIKSQRKIYIAYQKFTSTARPSLIANTIWPASYAFTLLVIRQSATDVEKPSKVSLVQVRMNDDRNLLREFNYNQVIVNSWNKLTDQMKPNQLNLDRLGRRNEYPQY